VPEIRFIPAFVRHRRFDLFPIVFDMLPKHDPTRSDPHHFPARLLPSAAISRGLHRGRSGCAMVT
jgi:hypothetical protein